jgi:hypothetical protein
MSPSGTPRRTRTSVRVLGRLGDEEADERFARAAGHDRVAAVGRTEARDDVRARLPLVIMGRLALGRLWERTEV